MIATIFNSVEAIETLIDRGADLEAVKHNGRTALHYAIRKNHESSCEVLLKRGANKNLKNKNGQTPLIKAAKNGLVSIMKILLKYDADTKLTDDFNLTAFEYAKKMNCGDIITAHETANFDTIFEEGTVKLFR